METKRAAPAREGTDRDVPKRQLYRLDKKALRKLCDIYVRMDTPPEAKTQKDVPAKPLRTSRIRTKLPPPHIIQALRECEQNGKLWTDYRSGIITDPTTGKRLDLGGETYGSSGAPTAAGCNHFKSNVIYYREQTGQMAECERKKEDMYGCDHGHFWEPYLHPLLEIILGCAVDTIGLLINPEFPSNHTSPDAIIRYKKGVFHNKHVEWLQVVLGEIKHQLYAALKARSMGHSIPNKQRKNALQETKEHVRYYHKCAVCGKPYYRAGLHSNKADYMMQQQNQLDVFNACWREDAKTKTGLALKYPAELKANEMLSHWRATSVAPMQPLDLSEFLFRYGFTHLKGNVNCYPGSHTMDEYAGEDAGPDDGENSDADERLLTRKRKRSGLFAAADATASTGVEEDDEERDRPRKKAKTEHDSSDSKETKAASTAEGTDDDLLASLLGEPEKPKTQVWRLGELLVTRVFESKEMAMFIRDLLQKHIDAVNQGNAAKARGEKPIDPELLHVPESPIVRILPLKHALFLLHSVPELPEAYMRPMYIGGIPTVVDHATFALKELTPQPYGPFGEFMIDPALCGKTATTQDVQRITHITCIVHHYWDHQPQTVSLDDLDGD